MNYPVYTVSQVNGHIRDLLEADPTLGSLFVRGEISNYKAYPSGHHYFSLKDQEGTLRCVLFRREAQTLRFRPENGMKVLAFGRVAVFPRDGQYQLYVSTLALDGVGDLHAAFEQLKARLAREGLFEESHKKPIPRLPKRIALVTSPAGAAVRDMIRILGARWPMAEVYVVPCRVQGAEAPPEIAGAIRWVNAQNCADLIITGRGGGSMEDLWCFNEEVVAKAILDCPVPVISAVGHEVDFTIADFVADLRAPTPSAAAELCAPDCGDLLELLQTYGIRLDQAVDEAVEGAALTLAAQQARLRRSSPLALLQRKEELLASHGARLRQLSPQKRIDALEEHLAAVASRMAQSQIHRLDAAQQRLHRQGALLEALNPLKVLNRGFSVTSANGKILTGKRPLPPGTILETRLANALVHSTVTSWEEITDHETKIL